ncbi:hypothetical protein SO694_0015908 [Aureococcus anophagefferens]|uniref:Uncharacterized protein n=1 Tax=Aureococcus anophagefferens TaxID=44056 RepID=A0ABR1G1L9_AURAN
MAAQTMKTEFDQADYDALLKYYYEPIVQHNVELPGGRTLRRQTSPPRIEQDTLGFNALRKTINGLKKSSAPDSHNKIYQLLRELNAWQTRPPSLGGSLPSWQRGLAEESAVTETVDLTAEETVIDVDTYIIDVLLVGVLQPKPDPDGGAPRMVAVSKPALFVKREADDELAARPMQPKKRKASAAWEEECAALIANGDRDARMHKGRHIFCRAASMARISGRERASLVRRVGAAVERHAPKIMKMSMLVGAMACLAGTRSSSCMPRPVDLDETLEPTFTDGARAAPAVHMSVQRRR